MKLLHRHFEKDGKGSMSLIPDDAEDMWHIYNLIREGDRVRGSTLRKVLTESATGSSTSNRVRTVLTIEVESIYFDTDANMLGLKGKNIQENEYVKLGAYHTLDVELNRKFTLYKDEWDCISLNRIEMACDIMKTADAAAVVMQEGLAYVCLITSNMTSVRAKIELNIPKKKRGNIQQHEKGIIKFYATVLQSLIRHINFDVVKVVLLASPGFVREQFRDYIFQEAAKTDNKVIMENKSKFLLVHSSSGFKHSLKEVLLDPTVTALMMDTKALEEVKLLNLFHSTLANDPSRAFYGMKHVFKANESQAIDTLLILDTVLRCKNVGERKRFSNLIESVQDLGGTVKIFSSLHVSGEQLGNMTGIAAILRYPLPELEDIEFEDDDVDENEKNK